MRPVRFARALACVHYLSLVVACSGGGGTGGDGDGDLDGGVADVDGSLPGNPVTLTIGETPVAGIDVTTHDAAGLVLEHLVTGDSGTLALDVPAGGSFTVYYDGSLIGDSPDRRIALHVLAPPGGSRWSLPFPDPTPFVPDDPSDDGLLDVTVDPTDESARSVRVLTPCSSANSFPAFTIDDLQGVCDGSAVVPLVVATAHTGGFEYGWGMATDVSVTPGGPATPVTIDATDTSFDERRFAVTGIPVEYRSFTRLEVFTDYFPLKFDANNLSPGPTENGITLKPPAGLATAANALFSIATEYVPGEVGERFGAELWGPPAEVLVSSSVADFPLARVTLAPPDLSTPARPSSSWTRGPGSIGGVGVAEVGGENAEANPVEHLLFFAPASIAAITLPEVPEALPDWRPASVTRFDVTFEETGDPSTRFAAQAFDYHPDPPEPADGTYRFASGTFRTD